MTEIDADHRTFFIVLILETKEMLTEEIRSLFKKGFITVMHKTRIGFFGLCTLSLGLTSVAQDATPDLTAVEADLTFVQGDIDLFDGMATLHVGPRFEYLDATDALRVYEAQGLEAPNTIVGMIIPADASPFDVNSWSTTLTYEETGYVDSNKTEVFNPDTLLLNARKMLAIENQANRVAGLTTKEHLGWGLEPRFSHADQTLYWSQHTRVGNDETVTRYVVATLGRRGRLTLTANVRQELEAIVDARVPNFVTLMEFNEGHRYEDYVYESDAAAEYGIDALITGNYEPANEFFASLTGITGNTTNKLLLGLLILLLVVVLQKKHETETKRVTPLKTKKARG